MGKKKIKNRLLSKIYLTNFLNTYSYNSNNSFLKYSPLNRNQNIYLTNGFNENLIFDFFLNNFSLYDW